jgi:hypothetical protein
VKIREGEGRGLSRDVLFAHHVGVYQVYNKIHCVWNLCT